MCKEFCKVSDWFEWRGQRSKSVEATHEELTRALQWTCTDVLYSFLGIYTIGLLALCPDKFYLSKSGRTIKCVYVDPKRRISFKFLSENYSSYSDLNKLHELKEFLKWYQRLGNLCPIWPGGNQDRGVSGVYDLPNFYFNLDKCKPWTKHLLEDYPEAHLESALALQSGERIESFLGQMNGNKDRYCTFLSHICSVIDEREKAILAFAEAQGIDISQYKHPEKEF